MSSDRMPKQGDHVKIQDPPQRSMNKPKLNEPLSSLAHPYIYLMKLAGILTHHIFKRTTNYLTALETFATMLASERLFEIV